MAKARSPPQIFQVVYFPLFARGEHTVNATGASPVSIGLVERLMSASIAAAMFGGEGCESIGLAVQVQALVLCTFSTDPGRINTGVAVR